MPIKILPFLSLFLLIAVTNIDAATRTPEPRNQNEIADFIPKSHYKILGLSIDKLSLDEIVRNIGPASEYKGLHTASHICYKYKNQIIEFTVSGLGFGYDVSSENTDSSQCGISKIEFRNEGGIKVGLDKSRILELLGRPSKITKTGFTYIYWLQQTPNKDERNKLLTHNNIPVELEVWADIYSVIDIKFSNDIVTQFSVDTTETY